MIPTQTLIFPDVARYEKGIRLTGILLLHRISDKRITETWRRNVDIFEMVCGPGALQNVIFVTTMWNTIDMATGSQREEELRTDFWQSMITSGSRMARFESTYQSAWKILNQFTGDAIPLLLQKEMVEEKKFLPQTTAGTAHFQRSLQLTSQPPVTQDPCNAHPDISFYDTPAELANSSHRYFEIIELWQKQSRFVCFSTTGNFGDSGSSKSINSSHHPLIKEMVDKIAKQGPDHYRVFQKSAETAWRGCSFASDAIDFCKRLLKADDSVETLRAGLDDTKEVARHAHQDAQDMYHQFKNVRVELFKVRFILATSSTFNGFPRHQIMKDIPSGSLSL